MSNSKKNAALQPLAKIADILKLKDIKYLPGQPRNYRWNAKKGVLTLDGQTLVAEGVFDLIPLAFRIFEGEVLGFDRREWAELYFVNRAGHLSVVSFHGYSVAELRGSFGQLYYEDRNLTECMVTVTPMSRSNANGTYHVARFAVTPLPAAQVKKLAAVVESLPAIYRKETAEAEPTAQLAVNYEPPQPAASIEQPAEQAA